MRFLLDENAEFRIGTFLQEMGYDVTAISYEYPHGISDEEILRIAVAEQRILITNDRDFGELIFRHRLPHAGVIYFRMGPFATAEEKIARLSLVLSAFQEELGQFIVVARYRIRVRHSHDTSSSGSSS